MLEDASEDEELVEQVIYTYTIHMIHIHITLIITYLNTIYVEYSYCSYYSIHI